MGICAVFGYNEAGKNNPDVHLHRFPKEHLYMYLWINKCDQKDIVNPTTSRICSRHFTSNDYDLIYELRPKTALN